MIGVADSKPIRGTCAVVIFCDSRSNLIGIIAEPDLYLKDTLISGIKPDKDILGSSGQESAVRVEIKTSLIAVFCRG